MGDSGHAFGLGSGEGAVGESVTGVGGPVLLARTAHELDEGDVLAGRYQIEAFIGSGGSGRVLRAFDREARALVALKILRPEYLTDPVWLERFSRELRVGRQIQHRNVCRIFDIGEADGHRFLSMELATQGTVRGQIGPAALERPLEDRIADARALIEGVAALHAAGIIHRDIKPENLLRMEDGRLVVSDFGLATDPGAGPATTIMIGTPRYMAQEVVMGEPATARSDVWAVGLVVHEILFGQRPDRSIVKRGIRKYTPPKVESLRERRLAELCGRCTEDYPERRPGSVVEVLREFQSAVRGRRLTTSKTGRRQIAWAAIAVVSLATLGLLRDRWRNRAVASSSQVANAISSRDLKLQGVPEDWSKNAQPLATFRGVLHCLDAIDEGRLVRVIWGEPRTAELVDLQTGKSRPAGLPRETFESGCPQTSPDGKSLLFEKMVDGARQIVLAPSPDGRHARFLTLGSAPVWLPNGQEFVFDLDARHAARFSIATRQITIVADTPNVATLLSDKAVEVSGSRLAILYSGGDGSEARMVVHGLPGLEVLHTISVPKWTRELRFTHPDEILVTVVGDEGRRQLISVDLGKGILENVAEIPGADLQRVLPQSRVLVSRKRSADLWAEGVKGQGRLTNDGQSVAGSRSPTGELVIQRVSGRREVIVFRDVQGSERTITAGPADLTPVFLPDGKSWIFTRFDAGQILECAVANDACRVVHTDPLLPQFARPDPSGTWIAYVTALNNARAYIVSRASGAQRDLGASLGCPPVWSSPQRLWVATKVDPRGSTWAEVDVGNGRLTGQTRLSHLGIDQPDCGPPAEIFPTKMAHVVGRLSESATLWRRPMPSTAKK